LANEEAETSQVKVSNIRICALPLRVLTGMLSIRVFNIFKTWLDQYFNEEEDPEVLNRIEIFTEEVLAKDAQLKMPHQVLLRVVQRRVS
jgi:hypothetical protein